MTSVTIGLRRAAAVFVLVGAAVAPLRAELKYTLRMEMRKSSAPAPPADPALAQTGRTIAQSLFPNGAVEMVYIVGDKGTRIECPNGVAGLPPGTVLLQKPDGSSVVLNPADKTYWKMATPDMSQVASSTMTVNVHPTTETTTLLGMTATRIGFDVHVPLPQASAGGAKEYAIDGDVWVTDRYKTYSQQSAMRIPGLSSLGLDKLPTQGLALKTSIHGAIFGDQEIDSVVTKIGEVTVAANIFEIPAGYKEVPAPKIGGTPPPGTLIK